MAKSDTLKPLPSELSSTIQGIANKNNATIISFVAPLGVRTSPVTITSASIEESEIYRLEENVNKASEENATNCLHFIIHTPGGELFTSYKIANFLRSKFTKISAFVPYEAASGGTILCCAADEVYIGELGNLTSIDPQIRYKNIGRVSCHAFLRAVDSIEEQYGEKSPDEVSTPWQQMTEKLDPIIYDEMSTLLFTTHICAVRLLEKSGYSRKDAQRLASSLTRNYYTHDFPLFAQDAEQMGFRLKTDPDTMSVYGRLVSSRLQENHPRHSIDAFFPEQQKEEGHEG